MGTYLLHEGVDVRHAALTVLRRLDEPTLAWLAPALVAHLCDRAPPVRALAAETLLEGCVAAEAVGAHLQPMLRYLADERLPDEAKRELRDVLRRCFDAAALQSAAQGDEAACAALRTHGLA